MTYPSVLSQIQINPEWAFVNSSRKDTSYVSHGYHRYPAKFIPQLVAKLIQTYTQKNDLVIDPFSGCGTTLIEAKILNRPSLGADINPVAVLIATAKTRPLNPTTLNSHLLQIITKFQDFNPNSVILPQHDRINYWFRETEKVKLAFLLSEIAKVDDTDVRTFLSCGFSNILKPCSIWTQKSNKPLRDPNKIPSDPFKSFTKHIKTMSQGNADFYYLLKQRNALDVPCAVCRADARRLPVTDDTASLIVTSPPYATSYEYADLHQLSALWFGYMDTLKDFRKVFIGTMGHDKKDVCLNSRLAEEIVTTLRTHDSSVARGVGGYFSDMDQAWGEMRRVLKPEGYACIVVGDTKLKNVEILNAEVFIEQMTGNGFEVSEIIKREIPSKNLPSTRDKHTGRFTAVTTQDRVLAYPTEYILVFRKV